MKAIELTQEHALKLLEMCRASFPNELWGFGGFPTSEVGAEYVGMDYLDVTHINHKIACVKSRYEIEGDSSNLKVVRKDNNYPDHDKIEDGYIDNISGNQAFFTQRDGKIIQGSSYEETYIEGIHWFEFCSTHLLSKIDKMYCENYKPSEEEKTYFPEKIYSRPIYQLNAIVNGGNYKIHPVDYLYNIFKS